MRREWLPEDLTRQVKPRALKDYASSLGWKPVEGFKGGIAVYHRPDSPLHQVTIPVDTTFTDYDEGVAEAIRNLAAFERRPAGEVLNYLLFPPSDVLRFREISPDAEVGTLPLDHAVRMINGTRRLLLSVAHGVLSPQAYHSRLSRGEAEEFLGRCLMGQTERGGFVLNVACPLEPSLSSSEGGAEPFSRRVTSLLMRSLEELARVADASRADELLDPARRTGLSANFCESLLSLRPSGDGAQLTVSAIWSGAMLPEPREASRTVVLPQSAFEIAEALATRLRAAPTPRPSWYIGFVDALSGQPTHDDHRPSGEVDFTLFDDEQGEVRARGLLNADDYADAIKAHLSAGIVSFRATLRRLPRLGRLDGITDFERVQFDGGDDKGERTPQPAEAVAG